MRTIRVSNNACIKYVNRVMGLNDVTDLTNGQYDAIGTKIVKTLEPYYSTIISLGGGKFNVDGYRYILEMVTDDATGQLVPDTILVITVVPTTEVDSATHRASSGGITGSGAKIKKDRAVSTYTRRDLRKRKFNDDE